MNQNMQNQELDTYKTIEIAKGEVFYKVKGSKFIGYAYPVTNEDMIKKHLKILKKKHHAARHICYAYQLGVDNLKYRINDDGEPHNSAGQPIYGQILSENLTNVLVVVVRYFGGTKLGIGGLISAYKTTARISLKESIIVTKTIDVCYRIIFDYKEINKVMRIIKENGLKIIENTMEFGCEFKLSVRQKNALKIERLFADLQGLKITKISL
jgi:uncharacterized YigZ family protein